MKENSISLLSQLQSFLQIVFFNKYGRLRSGWRFSFFIVAFMFLVAFLSPLASLILNSLPIDFDQNGLLSRIMQSGIALTAAIFVGWLCGKLFEDLPFRALGVWFTKYWLKDFLLGCVIGIVTISFAVLVATTFGGLNFQFNASAGISAIQLTLLFSMIVFIVGAAFEEVFIRGYIFQTFVRADLTWLAIILTSVVFAFGHIWNPNAEIFSSVNTALAGVWLAVAYLKTRTLWLAFGLHFAWNWMMGAFYGIEVSGLTDLTTAPLLTEIDSGPVWITGGDYGLEGGIATTLALIGSSILILYLPYLKSTEEMMELTGKEQPVKYSHPKNEQNPNLLD
jgi:membrane protease YdiL (CAAX protease family)